MSDMKIFISWSGQRSQLLARALRDWLPLILQYVRPWLSDADISAGHRWTSRVAENLEVSSYGIICLTSENLLAPWVMFEAGALGKFVAASAVCPFLLDVDFKDISGPLAQFQAKKAEKKGTFELLESINKLAPSPLQGEHLAGLFDVLWPKLAASLEAIPASTEVAKRPRLVEEVLEDILGNLRSIESRLKNVEEEVSELRRPTMRALSPSSKATLKSLHAVGISQCRVCNHAVAGDFDLCPNCGSILES